MPEPESLLVFSDVHLGSDLNDSGPVVPRSTAIDADLVALLAHYRLEKPPAGRWRLVIAGDFIDFVGMAIDPAANDAVASATERAYGLGGAEAHVRSKLERVATRHADVFAELRRFLADGHALTLVHGNHDLELHWDSVKADFARLVGGDVDFQPWFFYRPGLAFIEHGHQYDPFCATPWILMPLSPLDPRRVAPSLSDTLLRYIVRRTPGMREYGHENRGLASYISWGLMLGARGTAGLFRRFFTAVFHLWRTARAYRSEEAARLAKTHASLLDALAVASSVPRERLDAALALHTPSLGRTPRLVLASVMLDRLALYAVVVCAALALVALRSGPWPFAALALVALALHFVFARARPSVDPAMLMQERAASLAKLFPAPAVVMGHTHLPLLRRIDDASVYVNAGSWAEEEPGANAKQPYRAPRTHVVIHPGVPATLLEWREGATRPYPG